MKNNRTKVNKKKLVVYTSLLVLVVLIPIFTLSNSNVYKSILTSFSKDTPDLKNQTTPDAKVLAEELTSDNDKVEDTYKLPEAKLKKLKPLKELKGDKELDQKVKKYLDEINYSSTDGVVFKTTTKKSEVKQNGSYVYAGKLTAITPDSLIFDLGIDVQEVNKQDLVLYKDFKNNAGKPKLDSNYLVIIRYIDGKLVRANAVSLPNKLDEIQHAVLSTNVFVLNFNNKKEQEELEKLSYEKTNVIAWSQMAKNTAKRIKKSSMYPIFVSPNTSLSQKEGDFSGSYYYIISGVMEASDRGYTKLKTYEGKTISLDFGDPEFNTSKNKVVWIHAVTDKGEVKSSVIQEFDGANLKAMVLGISKYTNESVKNK